MSSPTYQRLAALGARLAAEVDVVVMAHVARLRADPTLPDLATLPDWQLRDHLNTLVGEIAHVLRNTGETEARAPELLRDGSEILRLVSELHGAQRERLGWSEADIAREVTLLRAEVNKHLERVASGESIDRDALEHATLLVERLLVQSRQASFRGSQTAQRVR